MSKWISVCDITDINPATGVCALIEGEQVALFRPGKEEQIFALDNIDPFARASVLSRGLICEHRGQLWVASPLKKQHFRLSDGACMENAGMSIRSWQVRVKGLQVQVAV